MAILDDHSSTITQVRFAEEKSVQGIKKRLKLVSSGADKQIVVRNIVPGQNAEGGLGRAVDPLNYGESNGSAFQAVL